ANPAAHSGDRAGILHLRCRADEVVVAAEAQDAPLSEYGVFVRDRCCSVRGAAMTIRIELEHDSVLNGEKIAGRVEWMSGGKEPRKIEAVCQWRVKGRANWMTKVVQRQVEKNIGSRTQITIPFEFQIPLTPLSYDGRYFSIVWEIVATADLPFAFDEEERKAF